MSSFPTEGRRRVTFSFCCTRSGADPIAAWPVARDFLARNRVLQLAYRMTYFSERAGLVHWTASPDEVGEILVRERPKSFTLRYDYEDQPRQMIGLDPVGGSRDYISIKVATNTQELTPPSWVPLIEALAGKVRLAIAGLNDSHYTGWQRCADPQYYLAHYGPMDGLRILHRGPPPNDKIEKLDTAQNPGRLDLIRGGPAFVCADLWLGPAFWEYAPCTREDVLSQPWLQVRDTGSFLSIKAYPEPFTQPDGEQGEIQRRLWQLLFHSDCTWPPGGDASADSNWANPA